MGGTESSPETGRPAVSWSLKVERDVFEAVLRKMWSLGQEHQRHLGTRLNYSLRSPSQIH